MGLQDSVVFGRNWVLDALAGVQRGPVLNTPESGLAQRDTTVEATLAGQLKRAMNQLKAEGFAFGGDAVHYARLRYSAAYEDYRILSQSLVTFDPLTLESPQSQLAFWINLYNALIIDAVITYGIVQSVTEGPLGIIAFFRRAAYCINGQRVNAEDIEHGILRANRGSPFVPGPHFTSTDPRAAWVLHGVDPRIHFALNCASLSCPPISVYDAQRIDDQLDLAARNYVNQTTAVDYNRRRLCVSRLFQWFAADFGGQSGVTDFLLLYLSPGDVRTWLVDQGSVVRLGYDRYDWSLNAAVGLAPASPLSPS